MIFLLVSSLSLVLLTPVLIYPLQVDFCPHCKLWWCRSTRSLFRSRKSLGSILELIHWTVLTCGCLETSQLLKSLLYLVCLFPSDVAVWSEGCDMMNVCSGIVGYPIEGIC